jgi:thiol:disulfide interchange protein/DsbC/DsbD-like thiol-disulfide interchange protein
MARRLLSFAHFLLVCISITALFGCSPSPSVSDQHITATLIADQDSVSPGSTFTIGVNFSLEPGWHIYWKNPGDSGLPPHFSWSSDNEAVAVREPLWPFPQRLSTGPLVNYGYGDVLIPFPAAVASSASGSSVTISLKLEWLVCKDECLPGEGTLQLALPLTPKPGFPSKEAPLFQHAYERIPAPLERVSIAIEEQPDRVTIALIPLEQRSFPSDVIFFPEDRRIISNSSPQEITRDGDSLRISLLRDPSNRESIERIRGVLFARQGWSATGTPHAVSIDTNPGEPVRAHTAADKSGATPATEQGSTNSSIASQTGLFVALVFAFIGGVILNLMPCVFPVLSIKIVGFLEHAHFEPRRARRHALAFAAGVLVSFWILAVIIQTVRVGGEQLGWGFQLQSPSFVATMIVMFLALALLFLTNVTVGQTLQSITGRWRLSANYLGSFLSGVLATAVATPCTAPFMSSALAAALTLPTALTFLVFTALGCGMSAPYVLLSYHPNLLRFLPRPGEWMESFKQLMAFPLLATVIWLTRVFARQMGFEPPGLTVLMDLLWGLLAIGLGFWILVRATHLQIRSRRSAAHCAALTLFILGAYTAIPNSTEIEESRARACAPSGDVATFTDSHGLLWESFSEDRLAKVLAQGRPVFLDFTAEWCITCQVNEGVVFSSQHVRDLIGRKNVTLMRGDWTSKNPAITSALRRFGRSGVPLNVILSSPHAAPLVLPNILTPGIVQEALEQLP